MLDTAHDIAPEKPHVIAASNACYQLLYNKSKNRIYFTIHGYWKSTESVPDFLKHWEKAIALTKPGFTVLSDTQTMITHPQELNSLHYEAQKMIIAAEVLKVAHVLPYDKIASLQLHAVLKNVPFLNRDFTSTDEAEAWLNEQPAT